MKCQSCGYELGKDDNFCEHCGQEVQRYNETNETAAHASSSPTIGENEHGSRDMDFDKIKGELSSYWAFCLNVLKSPFNNTAAIDGAKNQMIYAIITIVLVAITIPLTFLSIAATTSPWGAETPVFSPFFYILILNALIVGVIFVVAKLGRSPMSIQQVLASYGSLMVISLAVLLFSLILSLLNVVSLSSMLLIMAMVTFILTIVYTVHLSLKDSKGGIDSFYGVMITVVLLVIVFIASGESIFNSLIDDIGPTGF